MVRNFRLDSTFLTLVRFSATTWQRSKSPTMMILFATTRWCLAALTLVLVGAKVHGAAVLIERELGVLYAQVLH